MINYRNLERGQSMAEYHILLPAAVMIAIAASLITGFIITSLGKTVDALQPYGLAVCQGIAPDEQNNGPSYVEVGNHSIEVASVVYNEADNTTTVVYTVTSGSSPSISHWTLGLPQWVADNVMEASEKITDWELDPTTGTIGVKFDTAYETEGGKGKGGKKIAVMSVVLKAEDPIATVSRDVILLISGQYDFGPVETAVKAGTDVYITTISAPISFHDSSLDTVTDCA